MKKRELTTPFFSTSVRWPIQEFEGWQLAKQSFEQTACQGMVLETVNKQKTGAREGLFVQVEVKKHKKIIYRRGGHAKAQP